MNALQSYKKTMTTVADFPFLEPVTEDDPRLLRAHAAVLDAFNTCEPAGNIFVRPSGESLPLRLANDGVVHRALLRVGLLWDYLSVQLVLR